MPTGSRTAWRGSWGRPCPSRLPRGRAARNPRRPERNRRRRRRPRRRPSRNGVSALPSVESQGGDLLVQVGQGLLDLLPADLVLGDLLLMGQLGPGQAQRSQLAHLLGVRRGDPVALFVLLALGHPLLEAILGIDETFTGVTHQTSCGSRGGSHHTRRPGLCWASHALSLLPG